jgi:hypothetical protein
MSYRKWLAVLAICALGAEAYAQNAPRYRAQKVATEDPSCSFTPGEAWDLNDGGAVIGRRCIDNRLFAFVIHDGNITLLPQDEEGTASSLRLNDRFDAILSVDTQDEEERNLLVLNNGRTLQINPLAGDDFVDLVALNNQRQVLAISMGNGNGTPSGRQSMLWHRGVGAPLGMLPDSFSSTALNLNDQGVAIGYNSTSPDPTQSGHRAVLWEDGTIMPLPLPRQAVGSRGWDINNHGQAALSVYFAPQGAGQPYLWHQGRLRPLPLLPIGADESGLGALPGDINNAGQIVGTTIHQGPSQEGSILRATVWRGGAVYDLNQLLVDRNGAPVTNLHLRRAITINDRGQILVEEFADFSDHPEYFVLTPVR